VLFFGPAVTLLNLKKIKPSLPSAVHFLWKITARTFMVGCQNEKYQYFLKHVLTREPGRGNFTVEFTWVTGCGSV
jgi:hypothetical protein